MADSAIRNATVARLVEQLETSRQAALRKARISFAAIVLMIVFVVCYMGWIFASVSTLDAGELTRIGALRIEEMGPSLQKEMKARALEAAPELMQRAREQLVQAPAQCRQEVEARLNAELDKVLAEWEAQVGKEIAENIDRATASLHEAVPQGTNDERVDAVMREVLDGYKKALKEGIDNLYAGHVSELQRLHQFLVRLQTASDLTEEEFLQKEILEVWVVLIQVHKIAVPSVIGK